MFTMCLAACLIALYLFVPIYTSSLCERPVMIEGGMHVCILAALAVTVMLCIKKKEEAYKYIVICILVIGVIMRVGYMLYTPFYVRGHDVRALNDSGHANYIILLMQGQLPPSNVEQFYHPPLFHTLAAIMCRFFQFITGIQDVKRVLEAGKLISCWASIATLFLSLDLCHELKLGRNAELVVLCISAFLPEHFLLAGRLNNDSLSVVFMTGIILYTLKWYRTRSLIDLVILALCFGLGMMTKISVGTLALVTGPIMLIVLYKGIKERAGVKCLKHYFLFGIIAFPLGMWYPIRNLILFDQSFTYVRRVKEGSSMYCGDHSLASRFIPFIEPHIFVNLRENYNVWGYMLRTAVFGETTFEIIKWIPALLLACNVVLAALSFVVMIIKLFHKPKVPFIVLSLFWVIQIISYILFNIDHPVACTMDFRYVIPTALIGSVFLGDWMENSRENIIKTMVWMILGVFCLESCLMYTLI